MSLVCPVFFHRPNFSLTHRETRSLPRIREYCTSAPPTYLGLFPFSFFPMIFSFFFPLLVLRPLSFVSLFFTAHQLPNHTHHRRRRQQHKRRPPTPDMKHSFGGHVPGRDQLTYTYTFSPSKVPPPPTDRPTRTDGPSPTPPQTTTMSMTPTTPFTPPPRETPPLLSEGHISPRPHPSQRLEQGHTYRTTRDFITLSSSHYATTQTTTPGPAP